ncbi:hypothetical protein GF366_00705 [Candidatus Peregrinibacteria bacterium]|nr:hypothetical protein [Candidatus Peregrinibacteria bacterium]
MEIHEEIDYKQILDQIRNFCLGKNVELPDDDIIEFLYKNNPSFRKEYKEDSLIQNVINRWAAASKKRCLNYEDKMYQINSAENEDK